MKDNPLKYIQTYANTDLFVFCYDHTDHTTLMKLKKYYEEVMDFFEMDKVTDQDAVTILMGCKVGEPSTGSKTNFAVGNQGSGGGSGEGASKRDVDQADIEQLKKLKIVFDMEYTTSTLLAKDD